MPATLKTTRRRVAVADDNPENLAQKSQVVRLAGFEAVPLKDRYPSVRDLLDAVKKANASALVCDHKLSEGDYAGFEGVEAVAELFGTITPGILVTDYVDSDIRHSIRKFRRRVPVLIRGGDLRPKVLASGIDAWEREVLRNDVPVERRPRRVLVEIDDIVDAASGRLLTVFVPRWRDHEAVMLPEDMVPAEIRPHLKKTVMLTASVNADAERIEDLYFENFTLIPEEDLKDEPA